MISYSSYLPHLLIICLFLACTGNKQQENNRESDTITSQPMTDSPTGGRTPLDSIAEAYVKLVLEVGRYDPAYVDAYYGPQEWKPEPVVNGTTKNFPHGQLSGHARALLAALKRSVVTGGEEEKMRRTFLEKQLTAVQAEIAILSGKKFSFDEESRLLYDAVAPSYSKAYFTQLLQKLDQALPGKGSVTGRLTAFRESFIIPKEKLDTVFKAAIAECRKRTLQHIALPENEHFTVEYVTDKVWSGYNWYKGNSYSLIQVNTDLPIYIDRAIDLAAHEGSPGHHVFNALLEKNLVRGKQWVEFSVYPLYSPQSFIAEGSANYGIAVAFPGAERVAYEKAVLFPLAGLDPAKADLYYQVQTLTQAFSYAGNEAARQYLNGEITKEKAVEWLVNYALMSEDRARQRVGFIEQNRSYVINYNYGQDLVGKYMEQNGGSATNPQKRWQLFEALLSRPHVPSGLTVK
jgi:hypothetical protein